MVKSLILFDNDGVLVDTEPQYFAAGQFAYESVGLKLDRARYQAGMPSAEGSWAQALAAGADKATVSRMREIREARYQELLRTEPIDIEGVVDALEELSKFVRMAVVTTSTRENFEVIHESRPIMGFMEFALVRGDYTKAKPHPEPYLAGLDRAGVAAVDALVVEDSERGLRSAVAAGIECAVVANEFTQSNDFSTATWRISALRELVDIVRASK